MANLEHLEILKQGVEVWNEWRREHDGTKPDFSSANLGAIDLSGVNLNDAYLRFINLKGACLTGAKLIDTDIMNADLSNADLRSADLRGADLKGANLNCAKLQAALFNEANLSHTNFSNADLSGASLRRAQLIKTRFNRAILNNCSIFGASVWGVQLDEADQRNLIITDDDELVITVDNLEIAQFIYLLLNNEKIRDVINTIGKKGVLILGRFTPERKVVLDAIREELRRLGYVPMLFDFEKPTDKDFTETIMTLAGMSLFIIADITNPKSSPLELQATVPNYMTPFVPIIQEGEKPFSMFKDLKGKFDWILDTLEYDTAANLIRGLEKAVVAPALKKHDELMVRKAQELQTRHISEYLKDS